MRVRPGAGDDVDGARVGHAGGEADIDRRYLKLLHHLLRETHLRAAEADRGDTAAVHGEPRTADIRAGAPRTGTTMRFRFAARRRLHARFELGELQKAAAVQRQAVDLLVRDQPADRC